MQLQIRLHRKRRLIASVIFYVGFIVASPLAVDMQVSALGVPTNRSLSLSSDGRGSVTTDAQGNALPAGFGGNKAYHTFTWKPSITTQTIGSMVFQYCTTPFFGTTCTMPTGMSAVNVTSVSTTGFAGTAPTIDTVTNASTTNWFATTNNSCDTSGSSPYRTNCVLVKYASATAQTAIPTLTVTAGNSSSNYVTNPNTIGTFYVRITVFSDNTYNTPIDQGVVTGSINNTIDITSKIQEQLNFSVGTAPSSQGTSCSALGGGGALTLGAAGNGTLSPTLAYDVHSYFRISTNATNGTAIYYSGPTLQTTGGTNTIAAAGTSAGTHSTVGSAQFGLGLDPSDNGAGAYSFTTLSLANAGNYGSANGTITNGGTAVFNFDPTSFTTAPVKLIDEGASPATIACDTGSVRYLANISNTTKPGVYQTSIAYIATPTY